MNRIITFCSSLLAVSSLSLLSCSSNDEWKVNGEIAGANGKTAILEVSDNGSWHVIDSVKIKDNGAFSFEVQRSLYPDIYRIGVEGKQIYFPVDSTETVTVTASFDNMDRRSTISGSQSADMMQAINTRIADALENAPADSVLRDAALKRQLAEIIQPDWSNISAYYLINKTIGQNPLYNPSNSFDRGIISAVANSYKTAKPDDPRTAMLEQLAISQRRAYSPGVAVEAEQVFFPELNMKDFHKKDQSLTELWKNSKVVIVNFTAYTAENSPALQMVLGEVYNKYHDKGLNIYQVGCDPEEYRWRIAAENIPWTAVYSSPEDASQLLKYNVQEIPLTFVIDASGEHFERVSDLNELDATVAKYLH